MASHNKGKLREIEALVAPHGIAVIKAGALNIEAPEETGSTYAANALIKAQAVAKASGLPALADDSGLSVAALDGAPGIYSARWGGPEGDFSKAMAKVEKALRKVGAVHVDQRRARFVCVLCLAWPEGYHEMFEGIVEGTLVWPPRGTGGFGYDPMFKPEGGTRTFAEMSFEEKHHPTPNHPGLSHRARAFARFAAALLP